MLGYTLRLLLRLPWGIDMAKKVPTTKKKSTEKEATKHSKSVATKSTAGKPAAAKKSSTVNAAKSAQSAKTKLKSVAADKAAKSASAKTSKTTHSAKSAGANKTGTGSKIMDTITGLLTGSKASKSKVVVESKSPKKVAAHHQAMDKDKVHAKMTKPNNIHKEEQKIPAKNAKQEIKVDVKHDAKNDKSKNALADKKKPVIAPAVVAKEQVKDQVAKEVANKEIKDLKSKVKPGKKGSGEVATSSAEVRPSNQLEAKKGTPVENTEVAASVVAVKDHSETGGSPENFNSEDIRRALAEINFFVSASNDECCERGCDNLAITIGYCRLHYIANWKDLQKKKQVLSEGKLGEMVEDLIRRFPIKFMEAIRDDLTEEKTFYTILKNLNIDSGYDFDEPEDIDLDSDTDIAPEARAATVRAFEDDSDI